MPMPPASGLLLLEPPFSPRKLPGLMLWLRDSGEYQASDFATPAAADADPVGGWLDSGPRATNVLQATSTKRGILKTGANGLNGRVITRFDGTDDHLGGSFVVPAGASGFTVLAAARTGATVPSLQVIFGSGETLTTGIRWAVGLGTDVNDGMGWAGPTAGVHLGSGAALAANTPYVCSWRSNKASWVTRRNGAQIAAPSDTSFPSGTWTAFVASENAGSWPLKGDLGELIVCFADIGAAVVQRAERYLAARWGVVLA